MSIVFVEAHKLEQVKRMRLVMHVLTATMNDVINAVRASIDVLIWRNCRWQLDETKAWYSFDDSSVSKKDSGEIRTIAAYVLFYRRRKTGGDGGQVIHEVDEMEEDEEPPSKRMVPNGIIKDTDSEMKQEKTTIPLV